MTDKQTEYPLSVWAQVRAMFPEETQGKHRKNKGINIIDVTCDQNKQVERGIKLKINSTKG